MTPDIKNPFVCRFKLNKPFRKGIELFPIPVKNGRVKLVKVTLRRKIAAANGCSCIFNACAVLNDLSNSRIIIRSFARIGKFDNLITRKLAEIKSVPLNLTYDFIRRHFRHIVVGEGVCGDLVTLVNLVDLIRLNFIVRNSLPRMSRLPLFPRNSEFRLKVAFSP